LPKGLDRPNHGVQEQGSTARIDFEPSAIAPTIQYSNMPWDSFAAKPIFSDPFRITRFSTLKQKMPESKRQINILINPL
jgi:hypothetical protein